MFPMFASRSLGLTTRGARFILNSQYVFPVGDEPIMPTSILSTDCSGTERDITSCMTPIEYSTAGVQCMDTAYGKYSKLIE